MALAEFEWAGPDDLFLSSEPFSLGLQPPFLGSSLPEPTLDLLTAAASPPSSPDSGFPASPGQALLRQAPESRPLHADIVPMIPADDLDPSHPSHPNKRARTVGSTSISIDPQVLEEQNIKKQRRMLKNRESACLSRRRKKEHMEGLERQVAEAAQEKDGLLARIAALEAENAKLKSELEETRGWRSRPAVTAATATGTTCLLVFLTVFSLFASPTSPPLVRTPHTGLMPLASHANTLKSVAQIAALSHASSSSSSSALITGKILSNPARLADNHAPHSDLAPRAVPALRQSDGSPDDIDMWVQQQRAKLQGNRDQDLTTDFTLTHLHNATLPPLFRLSDRLTQAMLDSLTLKSDTSYIFCTEARVFSARSPRQGEQPRMSVIMPAPALAPSKSNATVVTNNAMQVDCDIIQSTPLAFNQTGVVVG